MSNRKSVLFTVLFPVPVAPVLLMGVLPDKAGAQDQQAQPNGLREPEFIIDAAERQLDWLDRYLRDQDDKEGGIDHRFTE